MYSSSTLLSVQTRDSGFFAAVAMVFLFAWRVAKDGQFYVLALFLLPVSGGSVFLFAVPNVGAIYV